MGRLYLNKWDSKVNSEACKHRDNEWKHRPTEKKKSDITEGLLGSEFET